MRKSEILAALEKLHGDPEIEVKIICKPTNSHYGAPNNQSGSIDRINEYPRPEIVVIEK